jgi:hypothetical protein
MLEDMPTELFDEWLAFYHLEPFGEEWLQTSYLCSIVMNLLAKSKNDALELDAFVPDFGKKQQKRAFDDQYINKMRYSKRG